MIDVILNGNATDEDIACAQALSADERKKLVDRLVGALEGPCEETVLLEKVIEDLRHALRQARPVFAAGLSVDQAMGFIVKMVQASLDDLEAAGAADTDEYEKQELVLEKLNGFIDACKASGAADGDDSFEVVHLEYRGEIGALETMKKHTETRIANSLDFLNRAYGEEGELAAFLKGIDGSTIIARYIGMFGSESFFAYKHVAAPGESAKKAPAHADETEGD